MRSVLILFPTLVLVYTFRKLLAFLSSVRSIQNHPGCRTFISPISPLGYMLPRIPVICPGNNYYFVEKHAPFESAGWDVISLVYAFPQESPCLMVADATTIKEVTLAKTRFPKPAREYDFVSLFGRNIIASEGEEWKKYRKICAPAFSDRNNKLVWDASVQTMNELFIEVWAGKDTISVDHAVEITLPIALFILGIAGFGQKMSWHQDSIIPKGHRMSMKDALHLVSIGTPAMIMLPGWSLNLTKHLQSIKIAYEELRMYMSEMIKERQNSEKVDRHDLFSNLLAANDEDMDIVNLNESELIGNIYIFLIAGHETTAHTLCFTYALLALYPDEQEKLYKHILSVLPDGRIPTFEEMALLNYSTSVFYETLRMFPPVPGIPKISEEDTTLTFGNANGEKRTIPVPKGARIIIDAPGIHYNPRYWKDPHTFKPERFLDDWPKEAFVPFSVGPRACLGRKFFEVEGIAILTMIVSRYKITIKDEPQFIGETFEQRKNRVLKCRSEMTLTPTRVPLTFTRRT